MKKRSRTRNAAAPDFLEIRKKEEKILNDNQDFTTGSINKKLIRFMLPTLLALILQAAYSAVDLFIVGQFGSSEGGVSGVSNGANVMHSVTVIISALTTGVTVLIGQYLGQKKNGKIGRLIGSAVCFFLALSAVLTVLLVVLARPIAQLLRVPEEALDLAEEYIRICGWGIVFIVFYNFISCIFRGLGNSKLPLLFVGIACVGNIGGDLLFVWGLGLDVKGAAIATVMAQALSVVLSLFVISRQNLPFSFSRRDLRFTREIGRFMRISIPLVAQELLTNLSFLALGVFINRLDLAASSGYGVAQRIQSFIMLVPSSIMQSMASFVAQNVGAGNEKRAEKAMKSCVGFGAAIGLAVALFAFFKGDLAASIFTDNEAFISRAFEFLRGFALDALLTAFLFSFLGYFNGHGKSTFVMAQGLIQSFLIRLPVSYFMSIRENASLTYIGLAAPAATAFGIVLCIFYYRHLKRQRGKEKTE